MSTNDPEFYQAPKFTPESQTAAAPARLLLLRLHHRQHSGGADVASHWSRLVLSSTDVVAQASSSTRPRRLESSPRSRCRPSSAKSVKDRVEAFRKAVEEAKAVEPLVLTSDDLNALIEEQPEFAAQGQDLRQDRGRRAQGTGQHPTRDVQPGAGLGMLKGRYLERRGRFEGVAQRWRADRDARRARGQRQAASRGSNDRTSASRTWPRTPTRTPSSAATLRKLESLEIKDGKIILKVRAKRRQTSGKRPRSRLEKELPSVKS